MKNSILLSTLCISICGFSALAAVTFVGNDINTGGSWRTPSATKANDVDGDNVYGSAGYFLPSAEQFGYRNPLLSGTNAITPDSEGINALPSYITGLQFADAELGSSWGGEFSDCGTLDVVPGSLGLTGAGIMPSLAGTAALNLTLKRTSSPAFRLTLVFGNNPNPLTFFENSAISEHTSVAGNAGMPNNDDPLGMNVTVNDGSGAVSQLSGDASLATNTAGYTTYQSWDIPAGSGDISITIDLTGTTNTVPRLSGIAFDSLPITVPTILIPVSGGGTYFNGNPIGLAVTAGGTGIGYQWLKNSNSIAGANNSQYTILNSAPSDSGNYQVVVTNSVGNITSVVAVVTVLAPPVTVLLQDTFTNGVAGNLDGRTPDTVGTSNWIAAATWVTDGTQATTITSGQANAFLPFVPQPGRIYTLSADIEDTDITDPGSWVAFGFANGVDVVDQWHVVNNPVGWMLARGDINMGANQAFIGPGTAGGGGSYTPTNITTYKIILDTTPASAANWTFTYLANGIVWRSTTAFGGSGPTITRVGFGKIAAAVGRVQNFVLSQQVPFSAPFFALQPVGGTNFVGETKTFSVVVGGSDPITLQWQLNSNNIPDATNATLVLNNIQTSDSGSYRVVATNPLGSTNSAGASIQVVTPLTGTIYQDAFSYVTTNLNGQLPDTIGSLPWIASTVLSGDGINDVWSSDGTEVIGYTAASANAYVPFVPQAGNVYTLSATVDCEAGIGWIGMGFANGNSTDIDWQGANNPVGWFLVRPDNTAQINQVFVGPGTAGGTATGFSPNEPHNYAVLLDTRPANPSAWTFTFLRDSITVSGPTAFGGSGPTISTVGMGSYQTSYGIVQNFTLTVASATSNAPAVLTQPMGGTFLVGSQTTLSGYAGGSAPLTYQWQKNSNNIAGANSAQFTLANLSMTDSGYYSLVVSNSVGSAVSSKALITVVSNLPVVTAAFDAGDVLPSIPVNTDNNNLILYDLASVSPVASGNNFTGLNMRNGTTGTALENSTANPANVFNSGTNDFIFDTSVNTAGYDISAVITYSGWSDRAGQNHTVYYRQVGNPNFILLANVLNPSPGSGSLREAITNAPSGILVSGVDAIRVVVNTTFYVYREIEVDGTPTVITVIPSLSITPQSKSVLVSWPASATGYNLTGSSALGTGASWSSAGGTPTVVNGTNQVTIPTTNSTQFFRLVK